jgi:hypothetical protein
VTDEDEEPVIPADSLEFRHDPMVYRGHDNRPVAVPHEVVIESERPYRAYMLHAGGLNWEQVALQEGYPNRDAARADVRRYLDEGRSLVQDLTRKQLVERELQRLDLLQSSVWRKAMEGNLPAAGMALSVVRERIKLLRLDQDIRDDDDTLGGTVVVGGDEDSYTRGLEIAAGE